MKVVIQQEGKQVTGELQNEDISFGISNDYEAPFESSGSTLTDLVIQLASSGGSGKFQYMFSQFWRSASPPKLEITLGLLAEENGQAEVMDVINDLQDMFATLVQGGRLVPPGGVEVSSDWTTSANKAMDLLQGGNIKGAISELYEKSVKRTRLVDVYLGGDSGTIKFTKLLPESIDIKALLPVMNDGQIGRAIVTCRFANPNILTVGERFMGA